MKSLSQQIYEDGHAKGFTEGFTEGFAKGFTEGFTEGHAAGFIESFTGGHAEGHAIGLTEGQANSVYALMQHQNYDSKTAMDILNIQEKNRQAVRKLLESKFLNRASSSTNV